MKIIRFILIFLSAIIYFVLSCTSKSVAFNDNNHDLKSKSDTIELIKNLNYTSYSLLDHKPDSAKYYSDYALKLSKKIENDYWIAISMVNLSFSSNDNKDSVLKANMIIDAINIYRKNNNKYGEALISTKIGDNYKKINKFKKTLDYYFSALVELAVNPV